MENPIIRSIKTKTKGLSGRLKFPLILLTIVIVAVAAYLVWTNFLSSEAREQREIQEKYNQFFQALSDGEERQEQDIYGGETPQETIDLFIAALEKDDLELASKYFSLTVEGRTDPKWLDALQKAKTEERITEIVDALKKVIPAGGWGSYFGFESFDNQDNLLLNIGLKQNDFSNLWKIESI
jgi:hypothetical protein